MNKRGESEGPQWGITQLIEILIAIVIIALLIWGAVRISATLFGNQKEMQAKSTLDQITQALSGIMTGDNVKYTLEAPANWHIVSFDVNHNDNPAGYKKPAKYFGQNTLCICEKKACKVCQVIKMPLNQGTEPADFTIKISDIWFENLETYYNIATENPVKNIDLPEQEKAIIEEKVPATSQLIINNNYEPIIDSAVKKYFPDVRDIVGTEENLRKIVRAQLVVESGVNGWSAVGTSGEAGLVQIMPQNAINYRLKIFDPDNKIKNSNDQWGKDMMSYLRADYVTQLKQLVKTKTKQEIIVIDERFDETKNIDASVKLLTTYIKTFGDWQLGVMAYNTGEGSESSGKGVRGYCKPLAVISCKKDFAGVNYLAKVKVAMGTMA